MDVSLSSTFLSRALPSPFLCMQKINKHIFKKIKEPLWEPMRVSGPQGFGVCHRNLSFYQALP